MRFFYPSSSRTLLSSVRLISTLLLLAGAASGCSTTPDTNEVGKPADELHAEGVEALDKKRFKVAAERFQELDRKHPFSPFAIRAQVNLIYAHYKKEEYADAISMAERFVRLHPRHPYAPYAYYMRGLSFYQQIGGAMQDQNNTREALNAFQELISRFPKSDYAWEGEQMVVLCRDRLAEQEMVVARYYLDQEEYIAAINRFNQVVTNPTYNVTPYVEEALFGLVLASKRLGLLEEARNYAVVLGHNFPDRPFYAHALNVLEKDQSPTRSQLADLRKSISQKSVLGRLFQGVSPGLAPTDKNP
ncbi:MAG: outer membrane protein assembly factor BamD [Magnetococcales bacterium]|nr:outer membrane protein assembly factor BamD [Magnetococcales bacterium]MBF0115420.1 outer membrane protein assembly factor BamD [Magnetococcales bacterium]